MNDDPREMLRVAAEALESAQEALEAADPETREERETLQRVRRVADSCAKRVAALADDGQASEEDSEPIDADNPVGYAQSMAGGGRDVTVENAVMELTDRLLEKIRSIVRDAAEAFEATVEPEVTSVEVRRGDGSATIRIEEAGSHDGPQPFQGSIEGLESVREDVRTEGGDVRVESSWTEGTAIAITLDTTSPLDLNTRSD